MAPRLAFFTNWAWCVVMLAGWPGAGAGAASAPARPPQPSTIEAQAKFFQDFFSVQLSPHQLEFGHVCEDPDKWEQRYESKDYKHHRDMGKVRWGDKNGGYGEHYWDLNHGGAGDHGDHDDGSHDQHDQHDHSGDGAKNHIGDSHDEPNDKNPNYAQHTQNEPPIYVAERSLQIHDRRDEDKNTRGAIKHRSRLQERNNQKAAETAESTRLRESVVPRYPTDDDKFEDGATTRIPNQQSMKRKPERNIEYLENVMNVPPREQYYAPIIHPHVQYEFSPGVSQSYQQQQSSAALPRLFLEPTTGHIIDRLTGHAYQLQPITTVN